MSRSDLRLNRKRVRGTPVTVIAAHRALAEKSPEGEAGRRISPSTEAVREAIQAGVCPWCKRGPFKVLAVHVVQRHGVGKTELREMAGLNRTASICDPTTAEVFRERANARAARGEFAKNGGPTGRKRTYSAAGLAAARENARRTLAAMSPEARAQARKNAGRKHKDRPNCKICGNRIGFDKPTDTKVCSDACRRENLSRLAKATHLGQRGNRARWTQ